MKTNGRIRNLYTLPLVKLRVKRLFLLILMVAVRGQQESLLVDACLLSLRETVTLNVLVDGRH